MYEADVRLRPGPGARVSPHLFGGLVEHLGRSVYGGVWDPVRDTPRADVLAAIRALGVSMLRWPGGCFSSWYRWQDGVGDRAARPRHERTLWTDLAAVMGPAFASEMGPPETNAFGTGEFLRYCADVPCEPLLVANLGGGNPPGSGTPEDAAAWVRHCNVERRTALPVRWWAVGNETWGAHEPGHCSASEYATRFGRFAEAMRREDPGVRLVACGVCPDQYGLGRDGPWADWNTTVLRTAGDAIDALSLHWYFPGMIGRPLRDDDTDYLQVATGADDLERILVEVTAEVDAAAPGHRPALALDEWGQMAAMEDHLAANHRLADAVFFAGCYNAMLRHASRLSMAMIAGLVNVLAPIQTEGDRHFTTAAYLVGLLYRHHTRSRSVPTDVECPRLEVPAMAELGAALLAPTSARTARSSPALDVSATTDATGTTVFLANRSGDQPALVTVHGLDTGSDELLWRAVTGPHRFARNDVDHPDVLGFASHAVTARRDRVRVEIPPATAGALVTGPRWP
ncbi:MAG: alpha-N-arabinofuranosidase [Acidimicrobiia bacterium]|nr:MAG: alpha-N-arabinofuranosidase [Acidimicrobiia bacterium]